jgi:hypothetical protein
MELIMSTVDFKVGSLYKRKDIHDIYGGQRQGGISTPANYPFIFLFSSERGKDYGYQDGWCNRSSVLENFWPIIFHRTIVLV